MTYIGRRDFLKYTAAGFASGTFINPVTSALAEDSARRRPNIVYVLTDQWRAQATGYAGDPNVMTPHLDALASRSIHFANAVSVCPVCTPHRASLMTGRYPLSTGMFLNDLYLPGEELCMAEIFGQAGYETGYIGKWHLDGHGRDTFIPKDRRQGFDYWKVLECTHDYNNSHYYAGDDETKRTWKGYDAYAQTEDAQEYIRQHANRQRPFLLVVAYGGPHQPYATAPEDLKAQYPVHSIKLRPNVPQAMQDRARIDLQGYYAHCTAIDRCVGDLQKTLQETGVSENTIFIFTSDHGDMLGSQGQPTREKQRAWDESIRVPFLVSYPAVSGQNGRTVKTPINTPDILPTLLSLSEIDIPRSIEGEDLSGIIKNKKPDGDRAALVMSVHPFAGYQSGKAYRGIRTARYTYVRSEDGPWLMYDNENDPYQMQNLIGITEHAVLQKKLEDQLQVELRKTGDEFVSKQEYLKEWGYEVDKRGGIGYGEGRQVQSPAKRPK